MNLGLKALVPTIDEPVDNTEQLLTSKIEGLEAAVVLHKESHYLDTIYNAIENLYGITSTIEQLGIDDSMISLIGNEITSTAFLEKDKETTIAELTISMEGLQVQAKTQEKKTLAALLGFFKKKTAYVSELHDAVQIELKRVKKLKRKKIRYKDPKAIHVLPFGNSDKANKENNIRLGKQNELCGVVNNLFKAYYNRTPINDPFIYGLETLMSYKSFKDIFKWNFREIRANDKILHPDDIVAIIAYAESTASLYAGWVNGLKTAGDINEAALVSQPDSKYKTSDVLKKMVEFITLLVERHTINLENYLAILKNLTV